MAAPTIKRAANAYMLFSVQHRAQVIKQNPSLSFGDIGKQVAAKWKTLSANEKKPFETLANKAKEEVARQKAAIPPKPKRPLNAYILFANDVRPQLQAKNPSMKIPELGKLVGERWKSLSAADKAKYKAKEEAGKKNATVRSFEE